MAKWMDKEESKQIRNENKNRRGYQILVTLFKKYKVDFTKDFKVTNWALQDQKDFQKGMKLYGYEKMIPKYS